MAITEKFVNSAGGGAHDGSDDANAFSWAEMITDINAGGKAGNRYNCRNDATYSRTTTAETISGSGSSTSPIIIRGYSSSITDGFQGRSGGALVTTNLPAVTYTTGRLTISGSWIIMESMNFSGAPSNPTLTLGGADNAVIRSVFVNSSTNASAAGINGNASSARGIIADCDISLTGASGGSSALIMSGAVLKAIANRVKGGPGIGINVATSGLVIDNVIFASAGVGLLVSNTNFTGIVYGNTVVSSTGDGIDVITGTTGLVCVINNMITDNGGFGIDGVSAANAVFAAYNRTRDNTSGADNSATDWLAATKYAQVTTDTGGSETDYTNAGGNDYSLISSSPAKGVGLQNYRDIGALQRQESGGGGVVVGG